VGFWGEFCLCCLACPERNIKRASLSLASGEAISAGQDLLPSLDASQLNSTPVLVSTGFDLPRLALPCAALSCLGLFFSAFLKAQLTLHLKDNSL